VKRDRIKYDYRLGDIVRGMHLPLVKQRKCHINRLPELIKRNYKNTIAYQYVVRSKSNNDIDLLHQIVNEFQLANKYVLPGNDEIVIHLRLGDVIENSKYTPAQHLAESLPSIGPGLPADTKYIEPLQFFIDKIQPYDHIDNITLVTSYHMVSDHVKSNDYLNAIVEYFLSRGKIVSIRDKKHPDDDFVYLCNSKLFLPTRGHFSYLAKQLVTRNRGTVL